MSDAETRNVLFAGLGGQGVLVVSGITALAAFRTGYDVKQSEVHGMAQRGGSVTSHVRFGRKVRSPLIPQGAADFLVAIHEKESTRCRSQIRPGGIVIDPSLPGAADELCNKWGNLYLLGILSGHLPFDREAWRQAIRSVVPQKFLELNLAAFDRGAASVSQSNGDIAS
ncbi:MAG: indolepyruvate oxidoreductase subunit beta [bacterium]